MRVIIFKSVMTVMTVMIVVSVIGSALSIAMLEIYCDGNHGKEC